MNHNNHNKKNQVNKTNNNLLINLTKIPNFN